MLGVIVELLLIGVKKKIKAHQLVSSLKLFVCMRQNNKI